MGQYNVAPFERISLDIIGSFPATEQESKWSEAYVIPNQETSTVVKVLVANIFTTFRIPLEFHTDEGKTYESAVFSNIWNLIKIKKTRTTLVHSSIRGSGRKF